MILQSSWMNENAKETAVRKSNLMKKVIAFPNQLLSDETIDRYTQNLQFDEFHFFKNVLNLNRFHYDDALMGLLEKTDQRLWITLSDSTLPNAYYYKFQNVFGKFEETKQKYYCLRYFIQIL